MQKLGEENSNNILVSDNVESQLQDYHCQILLRDLEMSKSHLLLYSVGKLAS